MGALAKPWRQTVMAGGPLACQQLLHRALLRFSPLQLSQVTSSCGLEMFDLLPHQSNLFRQLRT